MKLRRTGSQKSERRVFYGKRGVYLDFFGECHWRARNNDENE